MSDATRAILLVEDSDDDVFFFERAVKLAKVGNPVIRVARGDDAIAYLKGEGPYADRVAFPLPFYIMLDMRLPGVHGTEVLKWIRSQPQFDNILVAVLTGSFLLTSKEDLLRSGAAKFLSKPCKPSDIRTLTEEFPGDWQTAVSA